MTSPADTFRVVPIGQLAAERPDRVQVTQTLRPSSVRLPPFSFGRTSEPDFPINQFPPNDWQLQSYALRNLNTYVLRDAVVHSEIGLVTVDDCLVRDTLYHTAPDINRYAWVDRDRIRIEPREPLPDLASAIHAMCGYVGNRNYAHWWVDVVPVIGHALDSGLLGEAKLLISQILAPYQRQTLDLIPEISDATVFLTDADCVRCGTLSYTVQLQQADYTPHPERIDFIRKLMRRAGALPPARDGRKIYISRRDTATRPLGNTDAVEDLVGRFDYEIVSTSTLTVAEQMALFAQAGHVVAPHGAGLANMMFCRPGTRLLELVYDRWINWSMRRLAAVVPMTYGCVIGRQEPPGPDQPSDVPLNNPWTVDLRELESALQGMEGR